MHAASKVPKTLCTEQKPLLNDGSSHAAVAHRTGASVQPLHRFAVQRIEAQTRLFRQSGATHLAFFASNARLFATSSQHGQVNCLVPHVGVSALQSVVLRRCVLAAT